MNAAEFKVATFNLKHGATKDGYIGRPRKVARACAEIDADILALQEVDRYVWRSHFVDLFQEAAGEIYTDKRFAKTMGTRLIPFLNPGAQYGTALLVKGSILQTDVLPLRGDHMRLPWGRRRNVVPEPRSALLAHVELDNGLRIDVAETHIGGPLREQYIGRIATELAAMPSQLKLLLGDLNTGRRNTISWLAGTPLRLAPRPPELPADYKQVDQIAAAGLLLHSSSAHWLPISDHPVVSAIAEVG